jgi:cyclopropane fatty-acyl-phospholipid synthase-like methyltransferase
MSYPSSVPVSPADNMSASLSDNEFVTECYRRFLHRAPDKPGRDASLQALAGGLRRIDFVESIVASPEYYNVLTKSIFGASPLPNLQELKPDKFQDVSVSGSADRIKTFIASQPRDFDWLETMILDHGYYERPGVWSLAIDLDKRIIAEVISRFASENILEIGCATGPVLKVLREMGSQAEGVEISHMAHALAYPEIKKQIHFGDVLNLRLRHDYKIIVGMDVFEHLNPNKMQRYLQRCYDLLQDGGFLLTNIPAFGNDPVFGEVFPLYLSSWNPRGGSLEEAGLFSQLHVNEAGWPLNGHLTWATARWWQRNFERVGFEREPQIERALHSVYDRFFDSTAPARKSLFVFSKRSLPKKAEEIAHSVRREKSRVLNAAQ